MNIGIALAVCEAGGVIPPHKFTPSDISGLKFWTKSSDATIVGGRLSSWEDKTGGSNALVPQGTGPLYVATDSLYNGHPSFTFDATNGLVSLANVTYGAFTVFSCCRFDGVSNGYLYTHNDNVSSADFLTSGAAFSVGMSRAAGSSFYSQSAGWATSTTPKVFTHRCDGTHSGEVVRKNGAVQTLTSAVAGDPGIVTLSGLIEFFAGSGLFQPSTGSAAEFIVYDRALSDTDTATVEAYLTSTYNVT